MRQRTREFGIRMVLGATKGRIVGSILASGGREIAIGLLFGFLLALPAEWAFARLLKGSPFQTNSFDFNTYALAAVLLLTAALAAMYFPARQITKLDPMKAIRYE